MSPQQDSFLVSAVVSTYRSGRFFRGCLEDLVDQSLFKQGQLEIMVVDAASPDDECDVALEFATLHPNAIRYLRTSKREPLYLSWNRGIQASRGRLITNANTDDRHRFDALERMAQALIDDPSIDLVYADSYVTYQANSRMEGHIRAGIHRRPDWSPEIMHHSCHMGPQPMWRRSVHDRIGWFDHSLVSAGDFEYWLRMAAAGMRMKHLREYLCLYFENPHGICNAAPETSVQETRKVQALYANRLPSGAPDARDNYCTLVHDPKPYAQVLLHAKSFPETLLAALDSLEDHTAFPHVIDVVCQDKAMMEDLEERRRRGQIRSILPTRTLDPNSTATVDVQELEEFSQRGWLESKLLPANSITIGKPPLRAVLRKQWAIAMRMFQRLPIVLRRELMGKLPQVPY